LERKTQSLYVFITTNFACTHCTAEHRDAHALARDKSSMMIFTLSYTVTVTVTVTVSCTFALWFEMPRE
jgi:hypothetical protein